MITIDFEGPVEDYCLTGVYFRPASHQCMHYLISFKVEHKGQCRASIHTIPIPQRMGTVFKVENGAAIAVQCNEQHIMDIDIWGKYYFPEFMDRQQWYHDTGKEDYIMALAEVMKFALAEGLKFGNITPY